MELKELNSEYHSGLYVNSWVDKELFLELLLKHPKVIDYLRRKTPLGSQWQEEVRPIITVDCIEYCHALFSNTPAVTFDYEPNPFPTIGSPITFYEL